jgi:NAD-dependent SIR2 family protein deacetylase
MFEDFAECYCPSCDWRGMWDETEGEETQLDNGDGYTPLLCPVCGELTRDFGF